MSDDPQVSLKARLLRLLRRRKYSYVDTFTTPHGEIVLGDLARFCKAQETCFHIDARAHAVAEGRREVWLRIQTQLNLSEEQIADLIRQGLED